MLLCCSETRKTNAKRESQFMEFEGRCLRRNIPIRVEHRVAIAEIAKRTDTTNINDKVRKKRWRCLGHVFRMLKRGIYEVLKRNSSGKRAMGEPKET